METEIIIVMCAVTLGLLVVQITITLCLLFYWQNHVHGENGDNSRNEIPRARQDGEGDASPVFRSSDNGLMAGCPYAASSVYSNSSEER